MTKKYDLSLVGLGKLGLPLAICFADSNLKVLGVDIDDTKVSLLKNNITPLFEPGLQEKFQDCSSNIDFTTDFSEAIKYSDTTIILVNTPSDSEGNFSNSYIYEALLELGENMKKLGKYHNIIISSTVMPGSCYKFSEFLHDKFGLTIDENFSLSYIPDLVALGQVIHDFHNPDMVLTGSNNIRAYTNSVKLYKKIIRNDAEFVPLNLYEAEVAKISLNTFLTMKISFANIIDYLVANQFGVDSNKICSAIGLDKRIGKAYLKPGMPYGGACFPRDVKAFKSFSKSDNELTTFISNTNAKTYEKLFVTLCTKSKSDILFIGGSFKPGTPVLEGSPTIEIVDKLLDEGLTTRIGIYDPLAFKELKRKYQLVSHVDIEIYSDEIPENYSTIVIMHDSVRYKNILNLKDKEIINPWNLKQ